MALAACTNDGTAIPAPETVTVTQTVPAEPFKSESDEPEPAQADPFAPNIGDRSLKVGQPRKGRAIRTTLEDVRYPYPQTASRVPDEGNVWLGLRIEQCLADDEEVDTADVTTYNGEWAALTTQGTEYAGSGSSWSDWPSPKFPETVGLIAGRCNSGWLALEVPDGTKISSIMWRPQGQPTAEWIN